MALKAFERETVIGWSDDTEMAEVTTFNRALINKLKKFSKDYPDIYKLINEIKIDGERCGVEYSFPKKLITFRTPRNRKMTEEQKQVIAERMKKIKEKEGKNKNK